MAHRPAPAAVADPGAGGHHRRGAGPGPGAAQRRNRLAVDRLAAVLPERRTGRAGRRLCRGLQPGLAAAAPVVDVGAGAVLSAGHPHRLGRGIRGAAHRGNRAAGPVDRRGDAAHPRRRHGGVLLVGAGAPRRGPGPQLLLHRHPHVGTDAGRAPGIVRRADTRPSLRPNRSHASSLGTVVGRGTHRRSHDRVHRVLPRRRRLFPRPLGAVAPGRRGPGHPRRRVGRGVAVPRVGPHALARRRRLFAVPVALAVAHHRHVRAGLVGTQRRHRRRGHRPLPRTGLGHARPRRKAPHAARQAAPPRRPPRPLGPAVVEGARRPRPGLRRRRAGRGGGDHAAGRPGARQPPRGGRARGRFTTEATSPRTSTPRRPPTSSARSTRRSATKAA